MKNDRDDISEILADFEQKKHRRNEDDAGKPTQQIDFSKTPEDIKQEKSKEKKEQQKKQFDSKKADTKNKLKKISIKKLLMLLLIIIAAAAVIAGIIIGNEQNKSAYLKPYMEKYPDVEFPSGILEEYCDQYAQNPEMAGYIEITNPDYKSIVLKSKDDKQPYIEKSAEGSTIFNTVIYMQNNDLEEYFKDADVFGKTDGYITYSDLFSTGKYKIAGAFYTNTRAEDDNGYIFPYNVTETMTDESCKDFIDRIESRLLYKTFSLSRKDKFLTISCPTDFEDDFRFVIVAVLRDGDFEKSEATVNNKVHYPQIIYDKKKKENPYKLSSQWYPEIIVTDKNGNQKTVKQSIKDYE